MGTIVQRGVIVLLVALIIYLILRIFVIIPKRQAELLADRGSFVARFMEIQKKCSEKELNEFMQFLEEYKGSRIIRDRGKLLIQEFSAREKEELRNFYFEKVINSEVISVDTKDKFKSCLSKMGVGDLDENEGEQ